MLAGAIVGMDKSTSADQHRPVRCGSRSLQPIASSTFGDKSKSLIDLYEFDSMQRQPTVGARPRTGLNSGRIP
jgi:hypothetical protein